MQFPGLIWFVLTLMPLVFAQRLLHREIQATLLIITRDSRLALGLFSILFFPGVLLHELSHFLMAKLLGVPTHGFSILPHVRPDGGLQLGFVETQATDIVRDSLIGLAPLIVGSVFIAYAGLYRLQIQTLLDVLWYGQWSLFWLGLRYLPQTKDFVLWLYLVFAVSSTMMPSDSDRHAWRPVGVWVIVILLIVLFAGAGPWMLANIAPLLSAFLGSVAILLGISLVLHLLLLPVLYALHRILTSITRMDVA